jgi:hypothetical protein
MLLEALGRYRTEDGRPPAQFATCTLILGINGEREGRK